MSQPPAELDHWVDRVMAVLAEQGVPLDGLELEVGVILDLARDAAHGVARPAAPITTFLLGVAAGRSSADAAEIRRLAGVVGRAAAQGEPTAPRVP